MKATVNERKQELYYNSALSCASASVIYSFIGLIISMVLMILIDKLQYNVSNGLFIAFTIVMISMLLISFYMLHVSLQMIDRINKIEKQTSK